MPEVEVANPSQGDSGSVARLSQSQDRINVSGLDRDDGLCQAMGMRHAGFAACVGLRSGWGGVAGQLGSIVERLRAQGWPEIYNSLSGAEVDSRSRKRVTTRSVSRAGRAV